MVIDTVSPLEVIVTGVEDVLDDKMTLPPCGKRGCWVAVGSVEGVLPVPE
jgi:hypothetical protein